jgi:hypothetical protein
MVCPSDLFASDPKTCPVRAQGRGWSVGIKGIPFGRVNDTDIWEKPNGPGHRSGDQKSSTIEIFQGIAFGRVHHHGGPPGQTGAFHNETVWHRSNRFHREFVRTATVFEDNAGNGIS